MSLFDPDLATKDPGLDPDSSSWTYSTYIYYVPDAEIIMKQFENPYKPHVKFTNDKKQKQYRKYASRNISWKR